MTAMTKRAPLLPSIAHMIATCAAAAPALAQGGLQDLGTLPNDLSGSAVFVSMNGETAVGGSGLRAVRWTSGAVQDLGVAGADRAIVRGMSQDGDVVVGYLTTTSYEHPFRWDTAVGMQDLGVPWGTRGRVLACNSDGSVLVGMVEGHAVRWTSAQGFQDLGDLGSWFSWARAVNSDGSVVVGHAYDAAGRSRAFRWTASTGMIDLGDIAGNNLDYVAHAVSADGSVVVGSVSSSSTAQRAFRWTSGTGMQDLGSLGGATWITKCSADGHVVLGSSFDSSGRLCAFRWTTSAGLQPLGFGPSACDTRASDCSADGSVVIGDRLIGGTTTPHRPFRWTLANGFEDLGTLGGNVGVALATNASGSAVVGFARNSLVQSRPFLWREGVGVPLGHVICASLPNSSGNSGRMRVSGSLVAATNFVQVEAFDLPPYVQGIVVASTVQGYTFPFPNSQGALCLGGALSRFTGTSQIGASGAQGAFSVDLDLSSFPTPTGSVQVVAGETWAFQVWFRDLNPAPTSNFTEAVAIPFL